MSDNVPSVYEWAGGMPAFERLTVAFYKRVRDGGLCVRCSNTCHQSLAGALEGNSGADPVTPLFAPKAQPRLRDVARLVAGVTVESASTASLGHGNVNVSADYLLRAGGRLVHPSPGRVPTNGSSAWKLPLKGARRWFWHLFACEDSRLVL
jgi:hypothetical protein